MKFWQSTRAAHCIIRAALTALSFDLLGISVRTTTPDASSRFPEECVMFTIFYRIFFKKKRTTRLLFLTTKVKRVLDVTFGPCFGA